PVWCWARLFATSLGSPRVTDFLSVCVRTSRPARKNFRTIGTEWAPWSFCREATCSRPTRLILNYMLNYQQPLDLMFQALADPTRRVMVERLCRGPASVSELAKPLSMSLPAVFQHLQVLEASGLVRTEKTGRVRTCRLESKALHTAEQWITDRRAMWERRLDKLGDFL